MNGLPRHNWNEENHRRLSAFLALPVPAGAAAVFDWDNSCIAGDIGDAVFREQVLHRRLRLRPPELAELLPEELDGRRHLPVCGRDVRLADLKDRILEAYAKVLRSATAAAAEFAIPLLALMGALETQPGSGCPLAYSAIAACLGGFTPAEVRALARRVAATQLAGRLCRRSGRTRDGRFSARWSEGLRIYPEMRRLQRAMRRAGMAVVVSTASHPQVVSAMAALCRFPLDLLVGMESGAPANWGTGKTCNLRRRLHGEPLFVAGDSRGDVPMLHDFPSTRLRLLIDRGDPGMEGFVAAVTGSTGWLVQRADSRNGRFLRC